MPYARRGVGRIPDAARPALDLGRAIDRTLRDLAGVSALIRAAVAEGEADRDALGWADRLDGAWDWLDRAARGVSGHPRGRVGRPKRSA